MDETHLLACARYVELNPVRAGLTERAERWPWSSARAHLAGERDPATRAGIVQVAPLLGRAHDWAGFLEAGLTPEEHALVRAGERTGRPLGSAAFIAELEHRLARPLARRKPGPKPRAMES
jgi:putative transposase